MTDQSVRFPNISSLPHLQAIYCFRHVHAATQQHDTSPQPALPSLHASLLSTRYIQNHLEIIAVPFSRLVRFTHHIPNANILQMIALSKADPEASVFPCKEHVPSSIKISVLGQKISWPSRYLSVQQQPAFQTSDWYSSDSTHKCD